MTMYALRYRQYTEGRKRDLRSDRERRRGKGHKEVRVVEHGKDQNREELHRISAVCDAVRNRTTYDADEEFVEKDRAEVLARRGEEREHARRPLVGEDECLRLSSSGNERSVDPVELLLVLAVHGERREERTKGLCEDVLHRLAARG